ncbi:MAG: DDE-type integrase/transposase/recombinase [Chloroflexi bacterium]|nr:DDE-type integrase/transposase/recombinase [Chloroflexota bacterium]
MSFIRAKEIPPHSGNWYDYEVKTVHEGIHVRQKVLRYIGRSSRAGGSRTGLAGVSHLARPEPVAVNATPRVTTDALPRHRVSASFMANALQEYYSGMSLHSIEENIENQTDGDISHVAVNKWINKFTNKAIQATKDLHPKVGDTWIADETYIQTDVKGTDPKGVVFWDIIDAKTRFLLASRITTTRSTQDAKQLMELAAKRAGKTPKVIVTDKLAAYIDGIELAFGADTLHRQGSPFKLLGSGKNTSLIERFHNSLKDRTKVMRDLRDKNTLKRFTDGWLVYYNFYRPNMALNELPPAQVAGLEYDWHSWADVVEYEKEPLKRIIQESA